MSADASTRAVRVDLPVHLRRLAAIRGHEIELDVMPPISIDAVLAAIEARYPMLCGTIRDHVTQKRRPFLRFFACGEDLSHAPSSAALPEAVVEGREPLIILGAIAGG